MNAIFHLNGLTLQTERLTLRPFRQTDLDDFYNYACVEGVGEMAGWHHHQSKQETQRVLDGFIANDKTFAIVHKQTGKVIGSLGVEQYGMEDKLTEFCDYQGRELGYVLAKDYWSQGLMTEAVKVVIDYLFNVQNLDFLLCGHFDFNSQSKRVQQKCGFVPYRKLNFSTHMGTQQSGVMMLLLNPNKTIKLNFFHPETLIYNKD